MNIGESKNMKLTKDNFTWEKQIITQASRKQRN